MATAMALADESLALIGTLSPAVHCQAITGANPALLTLLLRHFDAPAPALSRAAPGSGAAADEPPSWLEWETRKQRR
ncbi:MAG TPA: hypothetical protein VHB98_04610, partial [Chloroflexota bacterium]|nr:hypothetical protein [Chloroflexota bacterium]